jgi:hypothetical protein
VGLERKEMIVNEIKLLATTTIILNWDVSTQLPLDSLRSIMSGQKPEPTISNEKEAYDRVLTIFAATQNETRTRRSCFKAPASSKYSQTD